MEQTEIKDLSTLLTIIPSKITEHCYIPLPVDVYVDLDYNLCCILSTKSLNSDIFQWYGAFVIYIGPLPLTWTWFCCCHILIHPWGSWTSSLRLAMPNNFVVLDYFYMSLKFHNNILLGIKDSYLKCIISLSSSNFAKLKYEHPLFIVSQSTLKFAQSLWLKWNFNRPLQKFSKIPVIS